MPGIGPRRRHVTGAVIALVLAAVLIAVGGTVIARADGDPASDVLAQQTVFIPADGAIPESEQAQLQGIVRAAQRSGYPVRVALIASRSDLGAIGQLWLAPARYAGFLGRELSQIYRGALLVLMPNGYGVDLVGESHARPALERAGASLDGARLPGHGAALASAAVTGVRRIAATAGHRLTAPAAATLPTAGTSVTGAGSGPWIAGVLGSALIVAAWTASLRARPWRSPLPLSARRRAR